MQTDSPRKRALPNDLTARTCTETARRAKDFGDFYTRAQYLVVDNPGAAKSLTWRIFNVCGPVEHADDVEKNPPHTIRRETSPRRIDTPWMEVNFNTNKPIPVIRIRPSVKPGEEFDLYGARLFLLDKDRRIVWHHRIWNTAGQVDYDAGMEFSDRDMLGQTLPAYTVLGNRVAAPEPPPPADMRNHLVNSLFNAAAQGRLRRQLRGSSAQGAAAVGLSALDASLRRRFPRRRRGLAVQSSCGADRTVVVKWRHEKQAFVSPVPCRRVFLRARSCGRAVR